MPNNIATPLLDRITEHRDGLAALNLPTAPVAAKWDNRPSWDKLPARPWDNRPSWDNKSGKK